MSILGVINALSPKDRGSRRLAAGIAYGGAPRQRLDVYGPVRPGSGPLPVVVFFYGGSWESGDRREYAFAGRALAALGYIAVVADYRLVPQVEYPAFLDDGAAAVRWVIERIDGYGGDAQRLALMGHSSGAYNAAMLALDTRYFGAEAGRIRAVVGLSGPYDFLPLESAITLRVFGAADDVAATQPVNLVTPAAPPMLLATGLADRLVYPKNTAALAQKLRQAGVEVVEKRYAGVNHPVPLLALGLPFRRLAPVHADVRDFLAKVL